jgi:hypothetical protein
VWGKIGDYLDQALQMLLRAQEQYNEGIDGIGLTVLVRNPDVLPHSLPLLRALDLVLPRRNPSCKDVPTR